MIYCHYIPLPTARKRQIYDQVGEEGLKQGGGSADMGGGYTFSGDPRTIFSQFFGGANPLGDMFDMGSFGVGPAGYAFSTSTGAPGMGGMFSGMDSMDFSPTGGMGGSTPQQDSPILHSLNCSLEELYQGCTKKMKISHKIISPDGMMSVQDKILEVNVKPGWKEGTKITFPQEGDQAVGRIAADIVFKIQEKPHDHYKRDGNNLKYRAKISLKQALCGTTTEVPLIDKCLHPLELEEIINPDTVRVIGGEGMPITKQVGCRGDMIVNFDIKFPTDLPPDSLQNLRSILPD